MYNMYYNYYCEVIKMLKCNLAVLLVERNIKISELHKRTGISRTTLTALAQNQSKGIQFDTFDTLCNFLNVKPNDLFTQEPFEYDFEVIEAFEYEKEYDVHINAEIKYCNENFLTDFMCTATFWKMNDFEPDKITDIQIAPNLPDKIKSILLSVPITFKVSFEQELVEAIKADLIVRYSLDESQLEVRLLNHY